MTGVFLGHLARYRLQSDRLLGWLVPSTGCCIGVQVRGSRLNTMIGFRAHKEDLELIDFLAGELEKIEAMLPEGIRRRKLLPRIIREFAEGW